VNDVCVIVHRSKQSDARSKFTQTIFTNGSDDMPLPFKDCKANIALDTLADFKAG
jgi:hypothetical protein